MILDEREQASWKSCVFCGSVLSQIPQLLTWQNEWNAPTEQDKLLDDVAVSRVMFI